MEASVTEQTQYVNVNLDSLASAATIAVSMTSPGILTTPNLQQLSKLQFQTPELTKKKYGVMFILLTCILWCEIVQKKQINVFLKK